jgi:hypothetical protein
LASIVVVPVCGQPLADVVAQGPGVGAPGHRDGGGDAAAGRGDLGVRQAGGAHGQLGVAVARVDRVGVRVDQARRDQAAAQVLDQVHVDDVVHHAGHAARQLGRRADPGDAVVADQDGGIADDLGPGPEPSDAGEQPGSHRLTPAPRSTRGSVPAIMSGHLPCMSTSALTVLTPPDSAIPNGCAQATGTILRTPLVHIGSVTVLHGQAPSQVPASNEQETLRPGRTAAARPPAPAVPGPRGGCLRDRARPGSPRPRRAPGRPGRPGCRAR